MASQGASSSSSSCPFGRRWPYDVFINFRREDISPDFTAHLYKALCQKGICTFMDEELGRGEEISPAHLKAVEESRISIVVLSENYASSTWCLDELMAILGCRETKQQIVLPVFYKVDPSDVRHQRRSFGEALAKHEDRFENDTVQRWKTALQKVANLSGWPLDKGNKNESKLIYKIVRAVSRIISSTYLNVANYPVGIESHVQQISQLLETKMNDICMVGIFGIGGIGKTTVAKAIYNSIAYQFEGSCFLANVRETANGENGLVHLQETLLYMILGNLSLKFGNVDRGINIIKERVCCKRVLVVLDDVDQLVQLEALSGDHDWFGLGSRIIITTRDEHLLTKHKVDFTYKMNELDHNKALQLFSWHAFQSDKPNDDFVELTEHALHYASGLPLALVVLGSDLYGRDMSYWEKVLKEYRRIPEKNILEKLKISYEGLEESEKDIFLDIACFFKGQNVKYVIKILDSCGFFPDIGIEVLINKSLIIIDDNALTMHDLLQDMGKEVVRQESPKEPGKRSRLWFQEDVRKVLEENTGTDKIEGISIKLPERELIDLSSEAFMKMKNLRLFICHNGCFSRKPSYLSNELRLLDWDECPLESFTSNFHGKNLVVLKIHKSIFKEPKQGFKNFQNMRIMTFSKCHFFKKMPDLSHVPNLEEFTLFECNGLVDVPDSLGFLDKLSYLSLRACSNLTSLPRNLKLKSLEMLYLDGCSSLQSLPEIGTEMERLRDITLNDTGIKELPPSVGNLTGLRQLYLTGCRNLLHIPSSVLQLQQLEIFSLANCSTLVKFTPPTKDSEVPTNSSTGLQALTYLDLEYCCLSESDLLAKLSCFSTLENLFLCRTDIVSLPACIKQFVGLKSIRVEGCKKLKEIIELPPNIEDIDASGCVSLESFPEVSKKFHFNTSELRSLDWIDLSGCYKMQVNIGNHLACPSWKEGQLKDYFGGIIFPGNTIPDWFCHRNETSNSKSSEIDITGQLDLDEISGIAFYAAMGTIPASSPEDPVAFVGVNIIVNGVATSVAGRSLNLLGSDHVWLQCSVLESSELEGYSLRVEFYSHSDSVWFKSCGVHLIQKHEENTEDHPGVLHLDVPDEETNNSVDFIDDIKLPKRLRADDDDGWSVESCHPQRKRRSPTFPCHSET